MLAGKKISRATRRKCVYAFIMKRHDRIYIPLLAFMTQVEVDMSYARMPPNPERPIKAATCEEARARVREASIGNPLISEDANQEHLKRALAEAQRLCGSAKEDDGRHE